MNDPNENEEVVQGPEEENAQEETIPEISYEDRVASGLTSLTSEDED